MLQSLSLVDISEVLHNFNLYRRSSAQLEAVPVALEKATLIVLSAWSRIES